MKFSVLTATFLFSLAIAAPAPKKHHKDKAAAATTDVAAATTAAATSDVAAATTDAAAASTDVAAATTDVAAATTDAAAASTDVAAATTDVAAATSAAAASTATAAAAADGSVLTASTYNDIQISGGTAGTAETEANALFANIDMTNLAGVSAADLKVIKGTHDAAEDAEVSAFNPAIAAASGAAADALTNGKIKNKVLKLTAEVLGIQVDAAQGGDDSELAAEQAKLKNNIALDTAAAGGASTAVPFTEST